MNKNLEIAARRSALKYEKFQNHLSQLLKAVSEHVQSQSISGVKHIETKEKGVKFSIMDQAIWLKYETMVDILPSQNTAYLRTYPVEAEKTDNIDEALGNPLEELDIKIDVVGNLVSTKPKRVCSPNEYKDFAADYVNTVIAYLFGS